MEQTTSAKLNAVVHADVVSSTALVQAQEQEHAVQARTAESASGRWANNRRSGMGKKGTHC